MCEHWAEKPQLYYRCVRAPLQPIDSLHTVPTIITVEEKMGIHRPHGDPYKPALGMRMSRPCNYPTKFGSTIDTEKKCPKCLQPALVDKIVSKHTGMWFSVSRDPITGKRRVFDRQDESDASKRARGILPKIDRPPEPPDYIQNEPSKQARYRDQSPDNESCRSGSSYFSRKSSDDGDFSSHGQCVV